MWFILAGLGIFLALVYGSTRVRDEVLFALNIHYSREADFCLFLLALVLLSAALTFPVGVVMMVAIHLIRERP